jgi:hypothetical protein
MKKKNAFHAHLNPIDTETHTFGCRHTNPIICSRHNLPSVCAFARDDNICLAPPASWPKQFKKLKDIQSDELSGKNKEK